jgi:hypothetical protein
MNILELDSYNLDDAVKFNDQLNPRLWDRAEHLRPEVRDQLLRIAQDFREFLGVQDLDLADITISGSNAAYTYTPNSDIDLHLVVNMPDDEVYRELFDAKKYQYNEQHAITIGGADVELYVQDSDQPHVSQGIYSLLNNSWLQVPRRVKSVVDDTSTRDKFEKVGRQIERAIRSGNLKRLDRLAQKIKKMRQTGLEAHGEFGPENLAFKILRSQGLIQDLYTARNQAKDQELSLKEKAPVAPFKYGFKTPVVEIATVVESESTTPSDEEILKDFIDFCFKELKLEQMPTIKLRRDPQWSVRNKTFGRYVNDHNLLEVAWGHRHIMDVLRTVAHELTHRHQHERENVPSDAGETGSPWENEANARAGILMRDYARLHPDYFAVGQAHDLKESWKFKSCTLSSIELSSILQKYYKTIFEQTGNRWYPHRCSNLAQFIIQSQRNLIKENAELAALFKFQQSLLTLDGRNSVALEPGKSLAIIQVIPHTADSVIELNGFKVPKKIKNVFTEKNGDIRYVEFNDGSTYPDQHFIRAGKGGGELEGINTLFFPTQQQAEQAVTMIGYKVPDGWQLSTINIDESQVKESASGYIPTKRQARDPRFSMALTQDIRPGQLGREANKLKLRTNGQGVPQTANPNGLFEKLALELTQFKKNTTTQAVDLKFHTVELTESQIPAYAKRYFECYNIEAPHIKFISNVKRFSNPKLTESDEITDIKPFVDAVRELNSNKKIKVGDKFAVLAFDLVYVYKEINGFGFTNPKEVADIKLHSDGSINYVKFTDGDRYPRISPATYGGKPITHPAYFDSGRSAESALSALALQVPKDWSLDIKDIQRSGLSEHVELAEVRMAPSNLMQWATSDEAKGIRAGFEAEMIFRDTASGSDDDYEMEPDYDADERCRSIQQVIDFFQNGDYGGMNQRQEARLQEGLDEQYYEWQDEQMYRAWQDERDDLIRDAWLKENPWLERLHAALVDGMELSDKEADAITRLGEDRKSGKGKPGNEYSEEELEMLSKYNEAATIADDILNEDVEQTIAKEDGFYDEVLQEFRDGFYVDDDSGFFDDVGLRWMSDVANSYDLDWPYMTGGGGNDGSRSWDEIGDSLHGAVDMPVKVSSGYHNATRKEDLWIVEPDTSLEPDDREDFGLEIVSPPMPLLTALEKLQQVTDWANSSEGNAYTNSSTGLHMGVSVPFKGGDVDYLKLILFLGDEYVLQRFGREANTYCKSAMSKFRENIRGGRSDPMSAIKLMQHGLLELAHKEIQKGVGDGKYTSAHIQKGYIEFRSPGGDWLAEESADPEVLQTTMLRFARAMSIAANPAEERKEYAKKLYKLVDPTGDDPALSLFTMFSTGQINAETLKKEWAEKTIGKEKKMNQRWKLYDRTTGEPVAGQEYNGYTENEAWAKAKQKVSPGSSETDFKRAYELRNMSEEQQWEVYDVNTGKTLEIVKGKNKGEVADAVYDKYVNQGIGFNVRPYVDPATMTPRAKLAKRIAEPRQKSDWDVVYKPTGRVIDTILRVDRDAAQKLLAQVAVLHDFANTDDLEIRPQQAEQPKPAQATTPDGVPIWEIFERETGHVVHKFDADTKEDAWEYTKNWLAGMNAEQPNLFSMRPKMNAGTPVKDIAPDVAQNFAQPADATEVPRDWEYVDRITGRVVDTVSGASYNQANTVQADIERRHPAADIYLRSVSPRPELEENFADGKGPGRPGDSQRHGIPKHATMAELEKASHAKGRKGQLARWQLNMRRGKKKHAS